MNKKNISNNLFLSNLKLKDVREDIFHFDPITYTHAGFCPYPVHQCPQLKQEGHIHEPDHKTREVL